MLLGSVLSTLQDSEEALKNLLDKLSLENEAEWRLTVLERWKGSALVKDVERFLPTLDVPDERDIINRHLKRSESMSANCGVPALDPADWQLPFTSVASDNYQGRIHSGRSGHVGIVSTQHHFSPPDLLAAVSHRDCPDNDSVNRIGQVRQIEGVPEVVPVVPMVYGPAAAVSSLPKEDLSDRQLDLPARAWHLFDVFFAYTNSWLCVINKVDILRVAYTYSTQPLHVSHHDTGSGSHAALWAVLAYASRQSSSDESGSLRGVSGTDYTIEQLYDIARKLIPPEGAQYETGHVQALLLLGLYNIGAGLSTKAWLLIGHAVRIALVLGLQDSDSTNLKDSNGASERKKHVFLGCFILDTLISASLGRVPHLRTDIIHRVGGIPENDLEEWNPWLRPSELSGQFGGEASQRRPAHTGSTFNQLIKISCILNDIICHSPNAITTDQYQIFLQSLQQWKIELPGQCQIVSPLEDIRSATACPLPHVLTLHLFHSTAHALLDLRKPDSIQPIQRQGLNSGLTITAIELFRCFKIYGIIAVPP